MKKKILFAGMVAMMGLFGSSAFAQSQTCSDAGRVVEVRQSGNFAQTIQVDDRCECGASAYGGQYGNNVTCLGNGGFGSITGSDSTTSPSTAGNTSGSNTNGTNRNGSAGNTSGTSNINGNGSATGNTSGSNTNGSAGSNSGNTTGNTGGSGTTNGAFGNNSSGSSFNTTNTSGVVTTASQVVRTVGGEVAGWIGTAWIAVGQTVSATNLKSNLDYLYNVKAPKPQNCTGPTNFLGWINGGWVCNEEGQPSACSFAGTNVANGNSVTAYETGSVPFGQTCRSQQRSCSDGTLSGNFQFSSCQTQDAFQCSFNGTNVAHGESVTAYRSSSEPFGQQCEAQTRTCTNGVLSGSFSQSNCVVIPPASCEFNGNIVANGDSVVAYEFANVPFGETCQAQTRSCTNGVLAGSFTASSCTVQPAATCVFNGQVLQDGESVDAYGAGSVEFGETCAVETRTCSNGVLSGSNTFGSCEVRPRDIARFYQRDFVVPSTEYYCMTEGLTQDGPVESFWIRTERDENNECPGIFSFEREETTYHLQNHPGIQYESNRYEGIGHDLASDAGTLRELCRLKGYEYVVGQATRSGRTGFRTYTSPGNNRLTYGSPQARFRTTSVTINQTFNGRYGWVECSNTPTGSLNGGGNGVQPGENCGDGNDSVFGCTQTEFVENESGREGGGGGPSDQPGGEEAFQR